MESTFEVSDENREVLKWILELDSDEIEKIEDIIKLEDHEKFVAINSSITKRISAEAEKAKHDGKKILYNKTAREVLPFIVYLAYIDVLSYIDVFELLDYEGVQLRIGAIFLFLMILFPLFVFCLSAKLYHEINSENREKTDNSEN